MTKAATTIRIRDLIEWVKVSAEWRAKKAEQYPDDTRNVTSSESLRKLAKRLAALRPDNRAAQKYDAAVDRLVEIESGELHKYVEFEQGYIRRYGFDYPENGAPVEFLSGLTEECLRLIAEKEEEIAEEEREAAYEDAEEQAEETAKEAADEAAKEAAEEAAKEAAEETYDRVYKEVYDEAYREALMEAVQK